MVEKQTKISARANLKHQSIDSRQTATVGRLKGQSGIRYQWDYVHLLIEHVQSTVLLRNFAEVNSPPGEARNDGS